ncbi:MAG: hypothetical protein H0S82_03255 [Anaerolineaceae bacterium]|jgi:hypothetical protein|nr:hypothetical protein [Anaerolineaceae bacterium]
MKRRVFLNLLIVFVLLSAGLLLFRVNNSPGQTPVSEENVGFRAWFWEKRSLDLVVHVLLVFGGALGIAAILPIEGADD